MPFEVHRGFAGITFEILNSSGYNPEDAKSSQSRDQAVGDQAAGEVRMDLHVRAFEEPAIL